MKKETRHKENILHHETVRHCNRLVRKAVQSLFLAFFKIVLNTSLSNLV